ncbi:peptidase domain-containing ABC transporter [Pleionea sediminis]|uniref:peptidase domain-containing ABC transporter n=1 Tax=Pleionea sediminis TaxID=2569479 RepID=UPI0013DDBC1B|nr:peptidase domain-containing ABC transporter [Pleionea sediminis]
MSQVININHLLKKRFPIYIQSEQSECGLACLAMISTHFGYNISLNELRQQLPVSLKGTTLRHLMSYADQLGLSTRAVRVEMEDLSSTRLPCILHWGFDHFVVLTEVHKEHVIIADPGRGKLKVSKAELSKNFTGVILEIWPSEKFQTKKKTDHFPIWKLFSNTEGLVSLFAKIAIVALMLEGIALAIPYFSQVVIDRVLVSEDVDFLHLLGLGFIFLAAFSAVSEFVKQWLTTYLGASLNLHLTSSVFKHLLNLPITYFEKRNVGDITARFSALRDIRELFENEFVSGIVDGLMVIITLVVMSLYSLTLTAIVVASVSLFSLFRWAIYSPMKLHTDEIITTSAKEQAIFLETVRGMTALKNFGDESRRFSVWKNRLIDNVNADVRLRWLENSSMVVKLLTTTLEYVIVVWLAATLIISNEFSIGMLIAFLGFRQRFSTKVMSLVDLLFRFKLLKVNVQRVADIIQAEPEKNRFGHGFNMEKVKGNISVKNVSFQYSSNDPFVLKDFSLEIAEKESVAIVGPSGMGKTTLLKLMVGLIQPTHGTVEIDGVPIIQSGLSAYRDNIAAVMQDDTLFSGSIRDNICMFDPNPDEQLIIECCKHAAIYDDIRRMPMGLSSLVGDMGAALSGGQKQRVLIARALYKQPSILFMDEATSHLDSITEKRVTRAISQLGITRVVIAHRKETIKQCDRVVDIRHINQHIDTKTQQESL